MSRCFAALGVDPSDNLAAFGVDASDNLAAYGVDRAGEALPPPDPLRGIFEKMKGVLRGLD